MNRILRNITAAVLTVSAALTATAQPDPNFHIYLCLGQSNTEGNAKIEDQDRVGVPERFLVMATSEFTEPERHIGEWYHAVPPLVRQYTGLTLMDGFGRAMLAELPDDVRLGVVPVAVGGCKIEHLDRDYNPEEVVNEAEWFQGFMKAYDNKPYDRLVACARKAKEAGVIKGILMHQGESNTGNPEWPAMVKKVYDNLLSDLGLEPNSVPLIAGEVVSAEEGGICAAHNPIIHRLPEVIPGAKVVSSAGLKQIGDGLHFTAAAYRELGQRYADAVRGK